MSLSNKRNMQQIHSQSGILLNKMLDQSPNQVICFLVGDLFFKNAYALETLFHNFTHSAD